MTIKYTITQSPIGKLLIAKSDRGLCTVRIRSSERELERTLRQSFGAATLERDDRALAPLASAILQIIAGKRMRNAVTLDMEGTAFQKSVWRALQRIPSGETRSYAQIATAIGKPKATRAVANACGANP